MDLSLAGNSAPVNTAVQNAGRTPQSSLLAAPRDDHPIDLDVRGSVEPKLAGKSLPVNSALQSAGRTCQVSMMVDHQVDLEVGGSKVEPHSAGQSVPVNSAVQSAGRTLQASMMVIPAAWQHHIPLGREEPFVGLGVPAKACPVPKAFPGPMRSPHALNMPASQTSFAGNGGNPLGAIARPADYASSFGATAHQVCHAKSSAAIARPLSPPVSVARVASSPPCRIRTTPSWPTCRTCRSVHWYRAEWRAGGSCSSSPKNDR